jgi:hypothetical protein
MRVQIINHERSHGVFRGACFIDGKPKFFSFKEGQEYPDLDAEGRAVLTELALQALFDA